MTDLIYPDDQVERLCQLFSQADHTQLETLHERVTRLMDAADAIRAHQHDCETIARRVRLYLWNQIISAPTLAMANDYVSAYTFFVTNLQPHPEATNA